MNFMKREVKIVQLAGKLKRVYTDTRVYRVPSPTYRMVVGLMSAYIFLKKEKLAKKCTNRNQRKSERTHVYLPKTPLKMSSL
jgi:hypothetical protein